MEVVLSEPGFWYLLKKGEAYYIDVNCEASFVGFTLMVALNADELWTIYISTKNIWR